MPEMLDRIVANYRQTGDVLNAAIRSGIDRSTFYRWKTRGEQAKSGPLREFSDSLTRAREEDIAFDVMRHKQVAHGGIFRLPVHDKNGRPLKDEKTGEQLYEDVVMLPNRQALETRLRWRAPDRFLVAHRRSRSRKSVRRRRARVLGRSTCRRCSSASRGACPLSGSISNPRWRRQRSR